MEHVQNPNGALMQAHILSLILYAHHLYIPSIYPLYISPYISTQYVLHAMRSAKARRIVDVQNLINYFIKIVFY